MAKGKFAIGALIGVAAGFVAGILTAPKSGKATREELKDAADKLKATAEAEAEKAKDIATTKAGEVKARAEEVASDVKEKAEVIASDAVEQAEDLKARTEQAIEGAKKGFLKKPSAKK